MKEPLISIVIPFYNNEKFTNVIIDNIINQDYKNIEIICVNDGSTDSTLSILEKLKLKDPRIKIITQKNQGHCSARNTGIKIAKGEFITLIDHDDQVHPQMISTLYTLIKSNNADVSVVNYDVFYGDKKIITNFKHKCIKDKKIKIYEGKDNILKNALVMEQFGYASWNKLFKTEIIKKMPSYPNVYDINVGAGEDAFFLFKYLQLCNKLVHLKDSYYFYRRFKNSLSHSGLDKNTLTQIKVFDYLLNLPKTKYPLSQTYIGSYICVSSMIMLLEISKSNYSNKEMINYLYYDCFRKNIKLTQKCKIEKWYRKYFMWTTNPFIKHKLGNRLSK